ncbi:EcsC family protein [Robertmurraya kyonggiensis]|uniref:EcsC family protein n=1 Tax=Robertmurraya kyonggiensis TaxID=1037680 RepID=A0A4U1D162_9BACI|nr:EcsC family protein [Robertmurraya kyonggiensis]TKC14746.1 EcsC family protein [Robertmurraya kyonggiensis]
MSKTKSLTHDAIMKALDWSYDKAINGGVPGMDTAIELADSYLQKSGTLDEKVKNLILWQNTKSATSGFLTGLGGLITLPVAVPANITSVILVQMRMVAAIAYMGGYDVKDDQVKSFVYACLAGNGAKDILKNAGVQIGKKLVVTSIKKIPFEVVKKINQTVGFRLLTKFGEKGVINLGKMVPLAGGIIGGTVDAVATNTIGNVAYKLFIQDQNTESNDEPEIIDMV